MLKTNATRKRNIVIEPYERALLDEMAAKETWCGDLGGQFYSEIEDGGSGQIKGLLDDITSGGLEIAPITVDQNIVTFPLLHSDLFPYIALKTIDRARRVEGASVGNVTIKSGAADNVETTLFSTTSLVAAIDATIYGCDIAIEVGRDFMSDSIVDIGALLQQLIGEKQSAWLDEQIALGDGTTEPGGILSRAA